jgi:hypothetical protein
MKWNPKSLDPKPEDHTSEQDIVSEEFYCKKIYCFVSLSVCSEVFRWKKLVKTDEEEDDQEKYIK